jgi:hypothetical protein
MFRSFASYVSLGVSILCLLQVGQVQAQQVLRVEMENLQAADGFWLTPVWVGMHDGSFNLFDAGSPASSSLELLAEEGNFSGIQSDFAGFGTASVLFGSGFGNGTPPLIAPGTTAFSEFMVNNTSAERYFSFASMVIPTNDAFIGNDNGMAFEVFDSMGNFHGPITIEVFAGNVWDAGTEVNDGQGAPFNTAGGTSTPELLSVRIHPGLNVYDGINTPAGTTINTSGFSSSTPIARFTLSAVPEPTSAGVLGLVALSGLILRRRRSAG